MSVAMDSEGLERLLKAVAWLGRGDSATATVYVLDEETEEAAGLGMMIERFDIDDATGYRVTVARGQDQSA